MPYFIDINKFVEGLSKTESVVCNEKIIKGDVLMDLPHLRGAMIAAVRVIENDFSAYDDIDMDALDELITNYFQNFMVIDKVENNVKNVITLLTAIKGANPVIGGEQNEFF